MKEDHIRPKYTVSDVCTMTGTTKAKLIDYDKKGVLCPRRITKGEGQEWRMYSEADIDRLGKIAVLLAYDFKIEEIKAILDDPEADIFNVVANKLEEIKHEEWRLRNLLLFAKFVNIADTELYEGLIHGPSDIDDFADAVRGTETYQEAMSRLAHLDEEALEVMLEELDAIVHDYILLDPELGFAAVENQIDVFSAWWSKHISLSGNIGYLEFWAVFEDDSIVVSEVEEIGGEPAAASLQMSAFYVCMRRLMNDSQKLVKEIAKLSESDIVLALDHLRKFVVLVCKHMGVDFGEENAEKEDPAKEVTTTTTATETLTSSVSWNALDLTESVLHYMDGILKDNDLRTYLDPEGSIVLGTNDVNKVARLIDMAGARS